MVINRHTLNRHTARTSLHRFCVSLPQVEDESPFGDVSCIRFLGPLCFLNTALADAHVISDPRRRSWVCQMSVTRHLAQSIIVLHICYTSLSAVRHDCDRVSHRWRYRWHKVPRVMLEGLCKTFILRRLCRWSCSRQASDTVSLLCTFLEKRFAHEDIRKGLSPIKSAELLQPAWIRQLESIPQDFCLTRLMRGGLGSVRICSRNF